MRKEWRRAVRREARARRDYQAALSRHAARPTWWSWHEVMVWHARWTVESRNLDLLRVILTQG